MNTSKALRTSEKWSVWYFSAVVMMLAAELAIIVELQAAGIARVRIQWCNLVAAEDNNGWRNSQHGRMQRG